MTASLGLLSIGIFAFLVLWCEGAFKTKTALFLSALLILAAMAIRGICMEHETLDYQNFLTVWVQTYRERGGFAALAQTIGNYNIPYNYFLALFSYCSIRDLYLIKWLSIGFDVILAWGMMRLVRCLGKSSRAALAAFFITLFLPTVVLNGAFWGQCDSIYTAFAVWALYFALDDKPIRSVVFIALSFAFKMQAVFIMPLWLILIFAKKIKWWHLGAFPLTYALSVLPAVLLGRPARDALYIWQAGSIGGGLNYNSSSIFALVRGDANTELLSRLGIAVAFAFLILLFLICFIERRHLSRQALLVCGLLICVAVPFFLPHMHDRYFFIADVLSVALGLMLPQLIHVPICVSFASLLGYHAYLKMRYLLPMRYGAAALLAVIFTLIIVLASRLSGNPKKSG